MTKSQYVLLTITLLLIVITAAYLTTNSINCSQKSQAMCLKSPLCSPLYKVDREPVSPQALGKVVSPDPVFVECRARTFEIIETFGKK
jgi:hypothetical protein